MDDRQGSARKKDGKCTEADTSRLEAGDLTDPGICAKLILAYLQNETAREEFRRFRRNLNVFVPQADLRAKLAELEAMKHPDARGPGSP